MPLRQLSRMQREIFSDFQLHPVDLRIRLDVAQVGYLTMEFRDLDERDVQFLVVRNHDNPESNFPIN